MVLIADCGSTKIDWCVLNGDKLEKRFFSTGVNALLMPEEKIRETFEKELALEVKDFSIDEVYYYGAGCLSDEICSNVSRLIAACVPGAKTISVNNDLLAAARALCGTEPGIACILGTGSNSCYYDGKEIKGNVSPLGYILGDEGSGYSIALSGIKAAIRAAEGSGVRTALLPACLDYFGITDIYELIELYYDKTVSRKVTAAFAEKVIGEAEEGDTAALDILEREAAELAATAKSLFDRIKSGSPIGLWGGIFQNSELYREIFTQKLGEDYKDRVKLLDFTPEIGAVIAALRENSVYINEIMLSNIKNTYRKATL